VKNINVKGNDMTNQPGDNEIKDARAKRAYEDAIARGESYEVANYLADKARHTNTGYYKNRQRKGHAQLRREKMFPAWIAHVENGGERGRCIICQYVYTDSRFTIALKYDEHLKYEPVCCVCHPCVRAKFGFENYHRKIDWHTWLKLRKIEPVGIRARLMWRLFTIPESDKEQLTRFEAYVLMEHYLPG
jgi:hypothetical protein